MMMKKINVKQMSVALLLSVMFVSIVACDDVLEEDITDDNVTIISPTDGMTVESNVTQFIWEPLKDADDYRLQVIGGTTRIILDTLIEKSFFDFELIPGDYTWRVRAENFAYNTAYSFPVQFSVAQNEDLTTQTVVLTKPSSEFYTNNPEVNFEWSAIEVADSYSFELVKNINTEEVVYTKIDILEPEHQVPSENFDEDAPYIWKVKAVNSASQTNFSNRILYLDTNVPGKVILTSPENEDVVTDSTDFIWQALTDEGAVKSEITYTLEIAEDIDFNSIIDEFNLTGNEQNYSFSGTGTVYWRVSATDKAGNSGETSAIRELTVN